MPSKSTPFFTRQRIVHILCWALVIGFPLLFVSGDSWDTRYNKFVRSLGGPLSYMLVFYVNYLWLVPRLLFKRRYKTFFLANIAVVAVGFGVLYGWWNLLSIFNSDALAHRPGGTHRPGFMYFHATLMLILIVALSIAVRMSQRWQQLEQDKKEAERSRTQAELKNLRNQLNPHFLLNTLNNIYALIAFDPDKAQTAVGELSKMLRHMLYDNQQNFVPLYKEVEFIHNYIELMKIRVTDSVKITTDIDVDAEDSTPIAPLIFISLIENAFKHGISQSGAGTISIAISNDAGLIKCHITNSNHPKQANDKSGSGIGLEQVKQRLALMYPHSHEWTYGVSEDGTNYISTLILHSNDSQMRNS